MAKFFALHSSFGDLVVLDNLTGHLAIIADGPRKNQTIPVVGIVPESNHKIIVLCPLTNEKKRIRNPFHSPQHVLFCNLEAHQDTKYHFMKSATNNAFCTAGPAENNESRAITSANIANEWERFSLTPVESQAMLPQLLELADRVDALFRADSRPRAVMELLSINANNASVSAILEGVFPLLSMEDLDAIADTFMKDAGLMDRLRDHFREDVWATSALPALHRWLSERGRGVDKTSSQLGDANIHSSARAYSRLGQNKIDLTSEFDFTARTGKNGSYLSLPHAINAAARRSVQPSRSVCVVATARNEGLYLVEWIAYYRSIGVEQIFLYSNDNDDDSDELLSALAESGEITWISNHVSKGGSAQYKAYGHALSVLAEILDYEWAIIVDLDEFVAFNSTGPASISQFLARYDRAHADCICLNWLSGRVAAQRTWNDAPVIRRFPVDGNSLNRHVKSIFRPRLFHHSGPHVPICAPQLDVRFVNSAGETHQYGKYAASEMKLPQELWRAISDNPDGSEGVIVHYFLKSAEEFLWKSSRNRGDLPKENEINSGQLLSPFFKLLYDTFYALPAIVDNRILNCARSLDGEMARIRARPGVSSAEEATRRKYRLRIVEIIDFYSAYSKVVDDQYIGKVVSLARGEASAGTLNEARRSAVIRPVIHIVDNDWLGVGNRMIQYMTALAIRATVPSAVISNVCLREWGIETTSVLSESNGGSDNPRILRIGNRNQAVDIESVSECLRSGKWPSVAITGYCQHVDNFLRAEAYKDIFKRPGGSISAIQGFDDEYIVCSIRGKEILSGVHKDYVQIPAGFYRELRTSTNRKLVFYGQIENNPYCDNLRRSLPNAIFIKNRDPISDFEVLQRSKNIVPSISTFAWLAAFLSTDSKIYLPVLGLFNPRQVRTHNLLPVDDRRYEFFRFPIGYSEDIRNAEAFWQSQQSLEGRWQRIDARHLRDVASSIPRTPHVIGPYLRWFDEKHYCTFYPHVGEAVHKGQIGSGLQHFCDHGFPSAAIGAFEFDERYYSRNYPDAAAEVSSGEFFDLRHHYVELGHWRGYRTMAPPSF